ncbi:hypothetical protein HPB51_004210 [Rhipicephalus microplus]|uniref:Uncharacterized protein n=1 Tax=Rhipicephalus microplus TaxID=6941 RepID=A0A9J6DZD2_RHIMP|nr:hypothetical protein HPB51_004210 [Rhipicephalus microplus]
MADQRTPAPSTVESELTAAQRPPAASTVTGPPSQEVPPSALLDGDGALGEPGHGATPVVSTDDDGTESAPVRQADDADDDQPGGDANQAVPAGDDVSSSEEYASPAADDTEEPAYQQMGRVVELPAPTEQATTLASNSLGEAGRVPADPTMPHGDVTGSHYATLDEAADNLGPESVWFLAELTAELRDLGRGPVSEERWARFEPILDRAEAAIIDHLRLPCTKSSRRLTRASKRFSMLASAGSAVVAGGGVVTALRLCARE